MSYKTILVHVNESRHASERVKAAAEIAIAEDAHLIGSAATAVPAEFYLPGALGGSTGALDVYLNFLRERANVALAAYEAQAEKAGVASFEKRIMLDETGAGISLQARYCDLAVVGQTDPDESLPGLRADLPEYVAVDSGRPVLVIPYAGRFDRLGTRAVVAWDASIEATRAVTGAIPLLRRASVVQVVVFNPKVGITGVHGEEPGADIALYLARHGIKVDVAQVTTAEGIDIGSALLSHAADFSADLMVMGCYGHSRLREVLAGGVTRTILKSMTVPTLFAH